MFAFSRHTEGAGPIGHCRCHHPCRLPARRLPCPATAVRPPPTPNVTTPPPSCVFGTPWPPLPPDTSSPPHIHTPPHTPPPSSLECLESALQLVLLGCSGTLCLRRRRGALRHLRELLRQGEAGLIRDRGNEGVHLRGRRAREWVGGSVGRWVARCACGVSEEERLPGQRPQHTTCALGWSSRAGDKDARKRRRKERALPRQPASSSLWRSPSRRQSSNPGRRALGAAHADGCVG
jgi:hypothetical protein